MFQRQAGEDQGARDKMLFPPIQLSRGKSATLQLQDDRSPNDPQVVKTTLFFLPDCDIYNPIFQQREGTVQSIAAISRISR
jgi:hypothetical protein